MTSSEGIVVLKCGAKLPKSSMGWFSVTGISHGLFQISHSGLRDLLLVSLCSQPAIAGRPVHNPSGTIMNLLENETRFIVRKIALNAQCLSFYRKPLIKSGNNELSCNCPQIPVVPYAMYHLLIANNVGRYYSGFVQTPL